ncbi:ATP-binding cassette domain-containing protein [Lactobacillus gallinarum]|uniref:ATP-binding cassette domain-containing protein n=1 Tax=Lactobacillus gallinarum TaxID=52242 RepID=UPI00195C98AF|nr:ATP-binding cassette domain-containing protein [Lactobacillus gallinarum]MBM6957599.1 ATP-binding cassette domain-containing protein [Lactobacillus gallinarum]MBM6972630.1 ATP-binding cassette domain-containing protein [Lactobacillus gallinarum]
MTIKIKNLSFSYKDNPIFQNLNAEFENEKVNYLIGYNGAGKSTLFDLISDLQTQYSGEIDGVPSKNEILYQTQNPVIFGALTGQNLQNFVFGISAQHQTIDPEQLSPHFKELYQRLMKRKVGKMSVGERRWLLLFLESHLNKKLFLLDEPLSGVDPVSKVQIEKVINDLAQRKDHLVIVTTHELNYMTKQDCYIHLLHNGEIRSFASYDDFVAASDKKDPEEAFAKLVGA